MVFLLDNCKFYNFCLNVQNPLKIEQNILKMAQKLVKMTQNYPKMTQNPFKIAQKQNSPATLSRITCNFTHSSSPR